MAFEQLIILSTNQELRHEVYEVGRLRKKNAFPVKHPEHDLTDACAAVASNYIERAGYTSGFFTATTQLARRLKALNWLYFTDPRNICPGDFLFAADRNGTPGSDHVCLAVGYYQNDTATVEVVDNQNGGEPYERNIYSGRYTPFEFAYRPPDSKHTKADLPRAEMRVLLDPGHGGSDPGAVSMQKHEASEAMRITEAVANLLTDKGVPTQITHGSHVRALRRTPANAKFTLNERRELVKLYDASLLVSIHFNSFRLQRVNGTEVLYRYDTQRLLSETIQASLMGALTHWKRRRGENVAWIPKNRGVKRANLAVLAVNVPAALVECEFLTNPAVNLLLNDSTFRWTVANGIASGIESFVKTPSEV